MHPVGRSFRLIRPNGEASVRTVSEPEKRVPVRWTGDVVVAGAGVAGVFAAIAAARSGARTALIDRFGSVGGNIGPGMIVNGGMLPGSPHADVGYDQTVQGGPFGIAHEFIRRYAEFGGGSLTPCSPRPYDFAGDAQLASYVAQVMLEEAGVRLFLSTTAADPVMEGSRARGVYIEDRSGRGAVLASVVIDSTGEADIAYRAGAPVLLPTPEYRDIDGHAPVGMGLHYIVGGIDWPRWKAFHGAASPSADDLDWGRRTIGEKRLGFWRPVLGAFRRATECGGFAPALRIAVAGTDIAVGMSGFSSVGGAGVGQGHVQPDRVDAIDPGDGACVSALEAGLRRYVVEAVLFLRANAEGFEEARVLAIAPFLGARGGRCIEGERVLTMDDCIAGRRFDDVVYRYGEFRALKITAERGETKWVDFPFRAMLPKTVDGLLAAGRSASGRPDTLVRNRWAVKIMGEVAGRAAAMAARAGVAPRDLDMRTLQRALLDAGFFLGDDARLRELGLA